MRSILISIFVVAAVSFPAISFAEDDVIDVTEWALILSGYADKKGNVDYEELATNTADRNRLEEFIGATASASLAGKSRNARLAFYINAYNASVVYSIVEKYPIKSVASIGGFYTSEKFAVAGKRLPLKKLADEMIHREFYDPRTYFVLGAGTKGSPPLPNKAMDVYSVDERLNAATKAYLEKHVQLQKTTFMVPPLVEKHEKAFVKKYGSVRAFLKTFLPKWKKEFENESEYSVKYKKDSYSEALNIKKKKNAGTKADKSKVGSTKTEAQTTQEVGGSLRGTGSSISD